MLIYKDLDEGRSHQSGRSYQFVFLPVLLQRFLFKLSILAMQEIMHEFQLAHNFSLKKKEIIFTKNASISQVWENALKKRQPLI